MKKKWVTGTAEFGSPVVTHKRTFNGTDEELRLFLRKKLAPKASDFDGEFSREERKMQVQDSMDSTIERPFGEIIEPGDIPEVNADVMIYNLDTMIFGWAAEKR